MRGLFEPLDWALVRAPLLPARAYLDVSVSAAAGDGDTLLPCDSRVRAALIVGSPDLFAALERTAPSNPDAPRLRRKLLRYLIRMSTRPTPYGLFAGVALAGWGSSTDLARSARPLRTRSRPDMGWLLDLMEALERRPEIRRHLRLVANPAALVRGGRVFIAQPPVSVRATGAVQRALALTRRPLPYAELEKELVSRPGATAGKVARLLTELWEQTVLLTDLRPPLTTSPVPYVLERLQQIPAAAQTAEDLTALIDALQRWDQTPLEERSVAWPEVVKQARGISTPSTPAAVVQVDMALPLAGTNVHHRLARDAARAAELLLRVSHHPHGRPHLDAYREAFRERYGPEVEVPLLELLDPQFGLGPPVDQPGPPGQPARERTLRDIALDAGRERRLVVDLDDETLSRLQTWAPSAASAPISLDVTLSVAAASPAAIDAGDYTLVVGPNVGADAAGRNLGRFADLLEAEARRALEHAAALELRHARGARYAEIVYLPRHARSANVAIRPPVRDHEIAFGATAGVPRHRVVPLDGLVVGLRDGRFHCRWPAAGTDVIACQGHMLNTAQAPSVARFLDDIARDRRVGLTHFDWGSASDFPYLPRVRRGRIVLALAQWRPGTEVASERGLHQWRERWAVPRHVYLTAGDNRLLLDLDDPVHAGELREEAHRLPPGASLVVHEAVPGPADAWLPGPQGAHLVELVVPVVLRQVRDRATTGSRATVQPVTGAMRVRPPGSDWLYLKLYCPPVLQDDVIAGPLRRLGELGQLAGLTDRWFFVRYADPEPHMRVRFHGDPPTLLNRFLPEICSVAGELVSEGVCRRFGFDTYQREIERYGGPDGAAAAEAIFAIDSVAAAELLSVSRDQARAIDRAVLAALSVDDLLDALGVGTAERLAWYRDRTSLSRADGREYRRHRQALLRGLAQSEAHTAVLARRRASLAPVAARLRALARDGQLQHSLTTLTSSYVHMHCNRLLGVGDRPEETVMRLLRRRSESLLHVASDSGTISDQ